MDGGKIDPKEAAKLEGPLTSAGKTFLELGDHECRYSIGKDANGGYRFCGEPVMDRGSCKAPGSYCKHHYDIATAPANKNYDSTPRPWMLDGYTDPPKPVNDNDSWWLSEAA